MKKVLLATAVAALSTTAAMADISISDYQEGKVHALMDTANKFEARGINIIENSNKIAVHKTVNAWNQGWNALEGENSIDLDASVSVTTLYTYSQGTIAVEATSISVSEDGQTATVLTGEGVSFEIDVADVYYTHTGTVSLRDNRADDVVMTATSSATEFRVGNVEAGVSNLVYRIKGSDTTDWDALVDKIEGGIQTAYDNGFEDGYSAGYDDGFAAAKGVVKN